MGLGESDLVDDSDGRAKAALSFVSCSICFDAVMDVGERSSAKLQCGHRFHLDCIGSAFNAKGVMQCPNCRNIEKGQWLYANGCRPVSEFNMEDLAHDDDLYDFNYAGMSFGVHWCPFSGLTSLPSSLDEGELSSNASHACPYIAYFGPPSASSGSISDRSSYNNQWSGASHPSSYYFHSMDAHWDQSSRAPTNTRVGRTEQSSIPSVTQRTSRNSSRPGVHPFVMSHSYGMRGGSQNFSRGGAGGRLQAQFEQTRTRNNRVIGMASSSGRALQEGEGREYYHHSFPLNLVNGDSIWAPFSFHPPMHFPTPSQYRHHS